MWQTITAVPPARPPGGGQSDDRTGVVQRWRQGAGATVGSLQVAGAPPDGSSLLMSNIASHGIAPSLYRTLRYDAVLYIDETSALRPLHLELHETGEPAETFPSGM